MITTPAAILLAAVGFLVGYLCRSILGQRVEEAARQLGYRQGYQAANRHSDSKRSIF